MKVSIVDDEALGAVRPLDLAAYLRASGWVEVEPSSTSMTVWEKTSDQEDRMDEVIAPQHQTWRDYPRRVLDVLETLSRVERRSQLAILRDIVEVTSDVVRIRAATSGPADGSIRLLDGMRLTACVHQLMLAAACAAVEPKRAYHSRKPKKAIDYLASLRMGQSERGSYIVSVLSRVAPALAASQSSIVHAWPAAAQPHAEGEPYERKVTRTLAASLDEVMRAAIRGGTTGSLDAFDAAVPMGVSADLCDGLASLAENSSLTGFDVSVSWSAARPGPRDVPSTIPFTMDAVEVIKEAGRLLREKSPVEDFELEGLVVSLSRPTDPLRGEATVHGLVDGKLRKVVVALSGEGWRTALDALDRRSILRCTGELYRDARPFALKNPRAVRQVNDIE